jgi:hypothetical protein
VLDKRSLLASELFLTTKRWPIDAWMPDRDGLSLEYQLDFGREQPSL